MTNAGGFVTYAATYEPYGSVLEDFGTSSSLGFTGEMHDSTGLVYLRARYADPVTGTFLTRDPVIGVSGFSQTFNPYIYVRNNPVNGVDPSGLFSFDDLYGLGNRILESAATTLSQLVQLTLMAIPAAAQGLSDPANREPEDYERLNQSFSCWFKEEGIRYLFWPSNLVFLPRDVAEGKADLMDVLSIIPVAEAWMFSGAMDDFARSIQNSNRVIDQVTNTRRVRTLSRSGADAGSSLRTRRTWYADTEPIGFNGREWVDFQNRANSHLDKLDQNLGKRRFNLLEDADFEVQGSRVPGKLNPDGTPKLPRVNSDIDLIVRVDDQTFDGLTKYIRDAIGEENLTDEMRRQIAQGRLGKHVLSAEPLNPLFDFGQSFYDEFANHSSYKVQLSITRAGSQFDTGPFIPILRGQ